MSGAKKRAWLERQIAHCEKGLALLPPYSPLGSRPTKLQAHTDGLRETLAGQRNAFRAVLRMLDGDMSDHVTEQFVEGMADYSTGQLVQRKETR